MCGALKRDITIVTKNARWLASLDQDRESIQSPIYLHKKLCNLILTLIEKLRLYCFQ